MAKELNEIECEGFNMDTSQPGQIRVLIETVFNKIFKILTFMDFVYTTYFQKSMIIAKNN